MPSSTSLPIVILNLLLIIPAIILHEVSHGYVALLLGDTTARDRGRLTLNPIAHVDLWGTIIMPVMMFLVAGFAIGYAKPVPIDPSRMTRVGFRNGMLLTGAAGPATNVVLANAPEIVIYMAYFFTFINLVLAFFNLIPIPPLDGSRVLQRFLKGDALKFYAGLERWGFFIILALVFILPDLFPSLDVFHWYLSHTVYPILHVDRKSVV
jgi:Zn-dependent protease